MKRQADSARLDEEYCMLMDLFWRVVDAGTGQEITDDTRWLRESQALAQKLLNHLATIWYLLHGTRFPVVGGAPRECVDHSSISVLVRAAFETYLSYYYIYGDVQASIDERRLRHGIWRLGGLLDRQGLTCVSRRHVPVLADDKKVLDHILSEIESNPAYASLSPSERKDATKGNWRLQRSWHDLAAIAGFDRQVFKDVYRYFCSYAHSGGWSIFQIDQAVSQQDQWKLAETAKYYGAMLMAHFVLSYTQLFPDRQSQLDADAQVADLARRRAMTWKEPSFRSAFELKQ
jgi:hypothetical protein